MKKRVWGTTHPGPKRYRPKGSVDIQGSISVLVEPESITNEWRDEEMIIRHITYHALPGKDVDGWLKSIASELRGVKGMREVLFIRSEGDSSLWGALMYFRSADDFENYKTSGPYKKLVESLRKAWLDESKPVSDQIYKIQDI